MPAIDIPDPLPPALTPDREVIEFLIERHLQEFGDGSLVARTWHWVLHGGSRGLISRINWGRIDGDGPPSAATLAAESTASQPPLFPAVSWNELNRPRFVCWPCTSQPEDELPLRFHPWDAAPAASEEGLSHHHYARDPDA